MSGLIPMSMTLMASSNAAVNAMRDYVTPTMHTLAILAGAASTFFIVNGGMLYMTSSGKPEKMDQAKRVLKNALIGIVLVLAAETLTTILTHAYGNASSVSSATLPNLQAIPPDHVSNGLIDILIKAVTGLLNNIIQAIAAPFLAALAFFTSATPLMADNSGVFNLWLAMVGITDTLFVIVIALLGFHVMSASALGFDEIDIRHLLPRIGFIFLLANTSIFLIDGVIGLSNAMITAIDKVSGVTSVWDTLTKVVGDAGGQGVAALLIMLAFVLFSVILAVYYVMRLVTLFVGAVLSPLVLLVWLIPGFRDFTQTAIKTYLAVVFTLFVHVVILVLAASLFAGMATGQNNGLPDTLMAMVTGLATILVLLKTQGTMMQLSNVSGGMHSVRQLGGQFINGVSSLNRGRAAATSAVTNTTRKNIGKSASSSVRTNNPVNAVPIMTQQQIAKTMPKSYQKAANKQAGGSSPPSPGATPRQPKTGMTYEAPSATPRQSAKSNVNKEDTTA